MSRTSADTLAAFAKAYATNGGNGVQAARAAGFEIDLKTRAHRLLKNAHVRRLITKHFRRQMVAEYVGG
jgi:hypothetical protein